MVGDTINHGIVLVIVYARAFNFFVVNAADLPFIWVMVHIGIFITH
jgi:hypothetical protein